MVDDLYYGHACACCTDIQDANLNISFDDDMLAEVLEEIYNEKVKPAEGEIPHKYFEANRDKFEEATAKGMAQSQNPNIADDKEFLKKYRHSIDVFSAFRSHAYAKRLADELYDSEGKLRPFEEWRKATESIQSHFNRSWLQTEYNTAVLRAEQAADWRRFEDEKEDFPCLKWMQTSSATPREQHKAFWEMGLTLPVDDPFWNKHFPGDLWNCKCYLEPTTAKPTPKKRIPKDAPAPAKGLDGNPGKKAEMVSRSHPYYPQPQTCIWLRIAKGGAEARLGRFFNAEKVKCPGDCNGCKILEEYKFRAGDNTVMKNSEQIMSERREIWRKLSKNGDYRDVEFDEQTGGLKATHKEHNFDRFKGWYEEEVQKAGFKNGNAVILEKEDHTEYKKRNTEGTWNGLKFEIAGKETATPKNIREGLKHCAKKPGCKVAVLFFPKSNFDCANFHSGLAMYSGLKGTSQWVEFDKIICIQNGNIVFEKSHQFY